MMEEHDCKCGCLVKSKLEDLGKVLGKAGPPRPGLVPQSGDPEHPGRWVRPEDAEKKPVAEVVGSPSLRREIAEKAATMQPAVIEARAVFGERQAQNWREVELPVGHDLATPEWRDEMVRQWATEAALWREQLAPTVQKNQNCKRGLRNLVKGLELQGLTAGLNGLIAKGACPPTDAVPLEQLKGDLARVGHPVKRAIALDAENRRLFFVDNTDTYLFAEYGSAESGFSLGRVGSQSEVAKDYDPVDLEPDDGGTVDTMHGEEKQGDDPGFVPSATPGVKPTDADERGFGKAVQASLDCVCGCLKTQGR